MVFCLPKLELVKYEKNIVKEFYEFLKEVAPND